MLKLLVDPAVIRPTKSQTSPLPPATDLPHDWVQPLQSDVLTAVVTGQPLNAVARLLCLRVEQLVPTAVCSVSTVDDDGRLHPLAAPSLPDAFAAAMDGLRIGPQVGACGSAAFHGCPVECQDADNDPRWALYKVVPLTAGLLACWSNPIKRSDGRVVGTFAMYFPEPRGASAVERAVGAASTALCAMVIEHHSAWSHLDRTRQCLETALSNISQGLCIFDSTHRLVMANRRYSEIYSLPPSSVRPGLSLRDILQLRVAVGSGPVMPTETYLDWHARDQTSDKNPPEMIVELTNGRVLAIHHQPLPDAGWVATYEDVTERKRAEAQIVYMARHDGLTGLPNRVLFNERMEQALAMSGRGYDCAVLCLDLDRFKAVNDTYGHPIGDALLQAVAERLLACVREVDTVTRLGGDEFAVLLDGLDRPESAGQLAQRIVQTLSEPFRLDGKNVVVGASVGIALAPQDASSAVALLKRADIALYRAKLDEKGSYRYFEPDMDARLQARAALERDLRESVRDESFELLYQPQFDLTTDRLCGFEALLRWRHPQGGLVGPGDFIALAEETGLIVPLGAWVLRQACAEAAHWPDTVRLAVNLSAGQFKDGTLVKTVRDALADTQLHAARLDLEITEGVLLKNSEQNLGMLRELRDLGVSISMDDFGTGYSSLSQLRSFPFDKIKIDQSFVSDLSQREESRTIIRAVVALTKSLGMKTLAEGVQTQDQLAQLRHEGCHEAQGYLFSRPLSATMARQVAHEGLSQAMQVA